MPRSLLFMICEWVWFLVSVQINWQHVFEPGRSEP